ncbi:molybdopterin-dependent oxidoreductase [Qipengyuania sp. CAU 1752]
MSNWQPSGDFIVHGQDPINAEPRSSALVAQSRTPQDIFYIRNHGDIPDLDVDHRVELAGLVDTSLSFCIADLRRDFPERKVKAVLQCAGNRRADMQSEKETSGDPWSVGAIGNAEWTGVALSDVLNEAKVDRSRARFVAFTCADQVEVDGEVAAYGVSITIERALAGDVLIAWALNGEPLTPEHGAPMRIIVPDQAGVRSAKWIEKIEVRDTPSNAPIQARDYKLFPASVARDDADWAKGVTIEAMPITSAICIPEQGESVKEGLLRIEGYAVAYGRSVARVDVSTDGGSTWRQATLRSDPEAHAAWTLWSLDAELPSGRHELVVKAVDGAGQAQPEHVADVWNFAGYLATAWHRVTVEVG